MILIAPPPIALIPLARKDIGFTLSDFTPLNLLGNTPSVMIVKADGPWQTLKQLVADAKKKPGQLTFGTPGTGTSGHFTMELFEKETGVDFIHVPLGGEAPVATGILGGNIHTRHHRPGNGSRSPGGWNFKSAGRSRSETGQRTS